MSFSEMKTRPGKYMRIESGAPEELRILNETPLERITHGFGQEESECGGEHCMKCTNGDDSVQRFLTNVYSHNNKRVMIWKYGSSIQNKLVKIERECQEAGKSLKDVDLKVEASGSQKGKKYEVTMKLGTKDIPQGLALYNLDLPF